MPKKIIIVGNGPMSKEQQEKIKQEKQQMGDDLLVCRFNHSPSWREGDPVDILFLGISAIKGNSLKYTDKVICFDNKNSEILESYKSDSKKSVIFEKIADSELGKLHQEIVGHYSNNLSIVPQKDISDYKVTVGFKAMSYLCQK